MTYKWTQCYCMRPYFRNVGVSVILFFGGMTVVSVIGWWTQPPNDPVKMPFVIATFALFTLLGVYLLLLHRRYRLFVTDSSIRQTGVFRDQNVNLMAVDELKWRCFPQGGSVVLSWNANRFKIELGNFERPERDALIDFLQRSIPENRQTGRQQFVSRFTDTPEKEKQAKRIHLLAVLIFGAHTVAFGIMWGIGAGTQYLAFSGINAMAVVYLLRTRRRKQIKRQQVIGEQSDAPKSPNGAF